MLKSVVALIAGFAIMTFTILIATIVAVSAFPAAAGARTMEFLAVSIFSAVASAAFGGYATASLAPDRTSAHVLILAVMVLISAASGLIAPQPGQETWYLIALLVVEPIGVVGGGRIRTAMRSRESRGTPA